MYSLFQSTAVRMQNQAENMYEIVEVTPRRKKKDQLARDSVKPIGTCPVEQKASSKRTYLFLILMFCGLLFLVVVLQVLTLLLTMMTDDHGMQITANNGSQSQLILYKQIGLPCYILNKPLVLYLIDTLFAKF